MHIHFKKAEDMAGFAVTNAKPGEMVKVLSRATLASDETDFYHYVEQLSNAYLSKTGILANHVYQFLLLIHQDLSADLYVNDFPIHVQIRSKKELKPGEAVLLKDIADVGKVRFPSIKILETDKMAFCFKVGWRFGLFFDFTAGMPPIGSQKLNIEYAMYAIGALYRYLSFYHIYKVLESEEQFKMMLQDGWFPFIEILEEYKELSKGYQNKPSLENRTREFISKLDASRIRAIAEKWWANPVFASKKPLIQAGISAYLQDSQEGYINCIKNLCTEIEGILRENYRIDTGEGNVKRKIFIAHLIEKGKKRGSSDFSLFLALPFLRYLEEVVFADFDVEAGKVELSRNSSSHGVAETGQYTKERAVQMILILDQIYFYIT